MHHRFGVGLKPLSRVVTYLSHKVSSKLSVSGIQAFLYIALADEPCACSDLLRELGMSHDELLQLTKSFQRSAKLKPVAGCDLLVLKPHPTDKRQKVVELTDYGQQVRDAIVERFIGPRGHPLT